MGGRGPEYRQVMKGVCVCVCAASKYQVHLCIREELMLHVCISLRAMSPKGILNSQVHVVI